MGDSMSSVVISGDTSGAITLAAPSVAGTNTITLPASTGTVMVSGNMPAFSYYQTSGTSLSNNTNTKVLFDTKDFDTNNLVSSSRFTPNIAGYYIICWAVGIPNQAGGTGEINAELYKNGSFYKFGTDQQTSTSPNHFLSSTGSSIVYLNGSTDYLEVYCYQNSGASVTTNTGIGWTYFNGVMVRSA